MDPDAQHLTSPGVMLGTACGDTETMTIDILMHSTSPAQE